MKSLLNREQFRDAVFKRDRYCCVIPFCGKKMASPTDKAFDAHHIMERRLWDAYEEEGGYFLDNGVTVCDDPHHKLAEKNVIPPQAFYRWLGLKYPWSVPASMKYRVWDPEFGEITDVNKWGEPFKMPTRSGTDIKYPSTPYLPFSPGHKDGHDDTMPSIDHLIGIPLVVTEKRDGSNVKMVGGTDGYVASRAGHESSASHPSFDYLKTQFEQHWKWAIPDGLVVFGEWLYAKHSIHYTGKLSLKNYLEVFGVYDPEYRLFLGWDDVKSIADIMNVPTVPNVIPSGNGAPKEYTPTVTFKEKWNMEYRLQEIAETVIDSGGEGIVVRSIYPYHYGQHQTWMAKYVRENHVQTDDNWSQQKIVKNEVRK